MFRGWNPEGQPVWGNLVGWDENGIWGWRAWEEARDKYIRPLCSVAKTVTLFGIEWESDKSEVLDLQTFVGTHFAKQGRHIVCENPGDLVDAPLFWLCGRPREYTVLPVLSFDVQKIGFVLEALGQHSQAGKGTLRNNGPWASAINFSKSVAKNGGFAAFMSAREAELFFPIEYKSQVEEAARGVEARADAVRKVASRKDGQVH